jgi:hypothetical protein
MKIWKDKWKDMKEMVVEVFSYHLAGETENKYIKFKFE